MAVVVGTPLEVFGFASATGPSYQSPASNKVQHAFVTVQWTSGTYAQGAGAASFNPAALIQSERNNGKTVTVRTACWVSPGDENGTIMSTGPCTVSANVVSCQLYGQDQTTEHANAAMNAVWGRPPCFCVTFTEAV